MKRWVALGVAAAVAGTGLVASRANADSEQVAAVLRDPSGAVVGVATFAGDGRGTRVTAALRPNRYVAPAQFHGFHVHANDNPANGTGCVADATEPSSTWFVSADAHLSNDGEPHGEHLGDMPSVLVTPEGVAVLSFVTTRLTPGAVVGRAVVLHAGPDNFGNVPMGTAPDQYTPNSAAATEKTRGTGNSGDRVACGVARKV
ncbi:MAG TPA: superoxide dismutase family protein [Mycobacteriales bacterium]|jgi:Cu-Zn family superoxide dismutase|nr:superoxide dismutase family protein [Mycobacteriales bacterium]